MPHATGRRREVWLQVGRPKKGEETFSLCRKPKCQDVATLRVPKRSSYQGLRRTARGYIFVSHDDVALRHMSPRRARDLMRKLLRLAHPDLFMRYPHVAATNTETLQLITASLEQNSRQAAALTKIYVMPHTDGASYVLVGSPSETRRSLQELLERHGSSFEEEEEQPFDGDFDARKCEPYDVTAGAGVWEDAIRKTQPKTLTSK